MTSTKPTATTLKTASINVKSLSEWIFKDIDQFTNIYMQALKSIELNKKCHGFEKENYKITLSDYLHYIKMFRNIPYISNL